MKITSPRVNPLGEALHFLRMHRTMYCRSEFTAPWALALPPLEDFVMFHIVTAGRCWLDVAGAGALSRDRRECSEPCSQRLLHVTA